MERELLQVRLKQGYFIVLMIMLSLTTVSSVVAVNMIVDLENDSRNINISGMQRMLSQKIALHAEQIQGSDILQVEYARKRMLASAIRFLENHRLLVNPQTNPNLAPEIAAKYHSEEENLDHLFKKFAKDAIAFSNAAEFDPEWGYSNQDIEHILLQLNSLVTLYEEVASHNVGNIFIIELAIWLVNLIIIVAAYIVLVKRAFKVK